jgi:predicted Zn finger-like uncharacterized protein
MIIQCEKCGTRFRLSEEKMRPEGIKARCARCKQIFFATPPPPQEPDDLGFIPQTREKEEGFTPDQSEVSDPQRKRTPPPTASESGTPNETLGLKETEPGTEQESGKLTATSMDEEEPAFKQSLDREQSWDLPVEEKPEDLSLQHAQKEDSESSFEDGSFGEFSFGLSPDQEEEEFGETDQPDRKREEEDFTFEPAEEKPEVERLQENALELPEEEETAADAPMFSFEEPRTAGTDDDLLDEVASVEDNPEPETADAAEETGREQFEAAVPQRRNPVASLMIFFLIVLIILTAVTGYLFWKQGPQAFERMLLELTSSKSEPVASVGRIELNDYTASFVQNEQAGELFVIHGRARNLYEEPRSTIQIKGVIFNEAGKPVMQQTVFGGNALTEEQLSTLPYSKIEEAMTNQFGDHLSNLNVAPSDSIPFTIVFRNLPEGVAEFTVVVVDSRPATPADSQQ